jgi:hypothetical protein
MARAAIPSFSLDTAGDISAFAGTGVAIFSVGSRARTLASLLLLCLRRPDESFSFFTSDLSSLNSISNDLIFFANFSDLDFLFFFDIAHLPYGYQLTP